MKVLITGATGLVGRRLCKTLLRQGHELVVIGRSSEDKFRLKFTLPCEYQNWNNLNLNNIQAVFHLAGEPIASGRWTKKKKQSILDSRTKTTQKLVEAFSGKWPEVFIGTSAIGYYGDRGDENLNEESAKGKGFLPNVCAAWEDSYQPFEGKTRLVKIRIGLVLDCNGGFLDPMEQLFSLGLGGRVSNGRQWMSWIHAEDLVNILLFSLENKIEGTYNAVAPTPVTNREWTSIYSATLKIKAYFPAPRGILKLALGEMSKLALDSQKVSSKKIISKGFKFKYRELKLALNELYKWKIRSGERLFESYQWIPAKRDNIFPFFSDAKNLEKITPPWLNFKVLKQSSSPIKAGTVIDYKISLKGLPMKWKTKIEDWSPPEKFVDDQLKGPYKKWHHTHKFEDLPGGTLMKDHVVYELPFGSVGQLIAGNYVKKDVASIFSYRSKVINKIDLTKS